MVRPFDTDAKVTPSRASCHLRVPTHRASRAQYNTIQVVRARGEYFLCQAQLFFFFPPTETNLQTNANLLVNFQRLALVVYHELVAPNDALDAGKVV